MADKCPSVSFETSKQEFRELKENYPDYEDGYIVDALQLYRERYRKDDPDRDSYYPTTPHQKADFTTFLRRRIRSARQQTVSAEMTEQEVADVYSSMSQAFTPRVLRARLNMITGDFLDELRTLLRRNSKMSVDEAFRKAGGFEALINSVFKYYEKLTDPQYILDNILQLPSDAEEEVRLRAVEKAQFMADEYQLLLDNRPRLIALAAPILSDLLGKKISVNGLTSDSNLVDAYEDVVNNDEQTEDDEQKENTAARGEQYIDPRTKALASTLSSDIKVFLQGIEMVDETGQPICDDLGYPISLTYQEVAKALVSEFGAVEAEDFMDAIHDLSDQYPWASQLYDLLLKSPDMQAAFYSSFKRYESIYDSIYMKKGKYAVDHANRRSNRNSTMQEAGNNIAQGRVLDPDFSLYDKQGLLRLSPEQIKEILDEYKKFVVACSAVSRNKNYKYSASFENKNKDKFPWYGKTGKEAMKEFLESEGADAWLSHIVRMARGVGFNVTKSQLKDMAMRPISKRTARFLKSPNRLSAFAASIASLYSFAGDQMVQWGRKDVSYIYSYKEDEFKKATSALAPTMKKEVDKRALVGDTAYSTHNAGGYMQWLIAHIANKAHKSLAENEPGSHKQWLRENFLRFEQFTLEATGQPIGWLKEWYDYNSSEPELPVQLITELEFNGVSYSELNDAQRALAPFLMWFFRQSEKSGKGMDAGLYRVMIESDYTSAWDYITGPIYDTTVSLDKLATAILFGEDPGELEADDEKRIVALTKQLEEQYGKNPGLSVTWTDEDNVNHVMYAPIVQKFADEVLMEYERIARIERRADDPHIKLSHFEENGKRFIIFPELNHNGFRDEYERLCEEDETGYRAAEFVRQQIVEQLQKVFEADKKKLLSNPEVMESTALPTQKGDGSSIFKEEIKEGEEPFTDFGERMFMQFSLNDYYARVQQANVFFGGVAFFANLDELGKRSMMLHAPGTPMYTPIGKKREKVAYIQDEISPSAFIEQQTALIKEAQRRHLISPERAEDAIRGLTAIKSTDGQGFRTLSSYREFRRMNPTNKWTQAHEDAYNRIMDGTLKDGDLDLIMDDIRENTAYNSVNKPRTAGWEEVKTSEGTTIRVPLIHKYSETVLLPNTLLGNVFSMHSPILKAFNLLNEKLGDGQQIDLFLFASNVKIEPFSVLDPMQIKDGKRVNDTAEKMAEYMYQKIQEDPSFIHDIDYDFVAVTASLGAHGTDTEIALASQAEKQALANVEDVQSVTVGGQKMSGAELREAYDYIETALIINAWKRLEQDTSDPREVVRILQDSLSGKPYNSPEIAFALTQVVKGKNGIPRFLLPLFAPSLKHDVENLLNSIIKNRLTKNYTEGANEVQVSSVGLDQQSIPFVNEGFLVEEQDRLGVEYNEDGSINALDCYVALNDRRLEQFTDPDGSIPPAKLRKLVEDKIIDKRILYMVGYRTPSDAEHSILPLRIKGFLPRSTGQNIIIAKEAMALTGHDYDGDKLRCHFRSYDMDWNTDMMWEDFNREKAAAGDEWNMDFKQYMKYVRRKSNPDRWKYRKLKYIEYDFTKDKGKGVFDGNNIRPEARKNALLDLLTAALTTKSGSMRLSIPGGADTIDKLAKTFHIVKNISDPIVRAALIQAGVSEELIKNNDVLSIYKKLRESSSLRKSVLNKLNENRSPFSYAYQVDAHKSTMVGTNMTGIYAMYSSSAALLQRMKLKYIKRFGGSDVVLFGKKIEDLFKIQATPEQELQMLIFSELVNAAVDNGKNPILGFLEQSPEYASMTFFLFAAGLSAEEIFLVLNQPAVLQLGRALTKSKHGSVDQEIKKITDDLREYALDDELIEKYSRRVAVSNFSRYKTIDPYVMGMPLSYEDIKHNRSTAKFNLDLLLVLRDLSGAADQLSQLVHIIRPDSSSGGNGPTNSKTLVKMHQYNRMKELIQRYHSSIENLEQNEEDEDENSEYNQAVRSAKKDSGSFLRIAGMESIFQDHEIYEGMSEEAILRELTKGDSSNGRLLQVNAYNEFLLKKTIDFMSRYFPGMKRDWYERAIQLAEEYDYSTLQDGTLEKIGNEMILWAMLSSKTYRKKLEDKRHDLIIDLPFRLDALLNRVRKANSSKEEGQEEDTVAKSLADNIFLSKLGIRKPETPTDAPRIYFDIGGPAISDLAQDIRSAWSELLYHDSPEIRQLAIDLFEYNLFENGYAFGRYEFAHMAPIDVIIQTPGYTDASHAVMDYEFDDDSWTNFIHQYYMNHWGDYRLVPQFDRSMLSADMVKALGIGGKFNSTKDAITLNDIRDECRYIVIVDDDVYTLYRTVRDEEGKLTFEKAQKLGSKNQYGQVYEQYNPMTSYRDIKPIVVGLDSNWGGEQELKKNAKRSWKKYNQKRAAEKEEYRKATAEQIMKRTASAEEAMKKMAQKMLNIPAESVKKAALEKEAETAAKANAEGKVTKKSGTTVATTADSTEQTPEEAGMPTPSSSELPKNLPGPKFFQIARITKDGVKVETVPASPRNVREARRQQAFVELNRRLREILEKAGISVGVLTEAEARLGLNGISDFDTAEVLAQGLLEMIRLAEGYAGEQALPEEFAHVALALLGTNHPLVSRLLDVLRSSDEALREAFEEQYDTYVEAYDGNRDKLVLEAAGKLVAKSLLMQQGIKTAPAKPLIRRIVDAIKNLLRKISHRDVQNAIFEANDISSQLAKGLLSGNLADDFSITNVNITGQLYQKTKKDITEKDDIGNVVLKSLMKRLNVLEARQANSDMKDKALQDFLKTQIAGIKKAIRQNKTESAILNFVRDTLSILKDTEGKLNEACDSGASANKITKMLGNAVDTIQGYAQIMEAITQAIHDGQLSKNQDLEDLIDEVSHGLTKFYSKCNVLGLDYFEQFLSETYGSDGLVQTIGRDKGRKITIREIATRGDRDISFVSRWIHSASDANDLVLKSVADHTRRAKWAARTKTLSAKRELDVAFDELVRETGTRDQTFMFQYKIVDGKRVKTGKYITKKQSEHLSSAQKKFYDVVMRLKEEADKKLPESRVSLRKIIMLRKTYLDKAKESRSVKDGSRYLFEEIQSKVLDMSENATADTFEVESDFAGNRVDRLPILYTEKGRSETYDDMTDDVASSLLAYVNMANEYGELDSILGMMENARRMSAMREIGQHTGSRMQQTTVQDDNTVFRTPYTVKQAKTFIQEVFDDFLTMHFYGHSRANEGTIKGTRISKRKVVDTANSLASLTQMALNLPQRLSNVGTGVAMISIESIAKGAFSMADWRWACAKYFSHAEQRLADTGKNESDDKLSLFIELFDTSQDNRRSFKNDKYDKSRFGKVFNTHLLYMGLTIGEDLLSTTTGLALAHKYLLNYKKKDGTVEKINLFDALEVAYTNPSSKTGAYLKMKDGVTKLDGSDFTEEDEYKFMKYVAGLNFDMQGIYNLDDRSSMQQYAGGALLIMYRKWIAPALKRRYAGVHYDELREQWEEGYWSTAAREIYDIFNSIRKDGESLKSGILLNWNKLSDYEKKNIIKACTEMCILVGTLVSAATLSMISSHNKRDDDDNTFLSWIEKQFLYQSLRLRNEIGSMAPTPMLVQEAGKILKSPFAAARPLAAALDGLGLLIPTNYVTTVKSGKYAGHSKAYKYFWDLPVISMLGHLDNVADPSASIRYYQNAF